MRRDELTDFDSHRWRLWIRFAEPRRKRVYAIDDCFVADDGRLVAGFDPRANAGVVYHHANAAELPFVLWVQGEQTKVQARSCPDHDFAHGFVSYCLRT